MFYPHFVSVLYPEEKFFIPHLYNVSNQSVAVGSLCDNIEVEHRTGDIWLGCHPNAMKLSVFNPEDPPGSEVGIFVIIKLYIYIIIWIYLILFFFCSCVLQVIRIKNINSQQPVVSQVYADNGRVIMGSSVAASHEKKLLIGTVFQKALLCNLK